MVQASTRAVSLDPPTTPRRNQPRKSATADPALVATPSPNRQKPRCKTCGKHREGHPRSGCPYASPPVEGRPSARRSSDIQELIHAVSGIRLTADVGTGATERPTRTAKGVHFTESTLLRARQAGNDGDETTCTDESRASIAEWRARVTAPGPQPQAELAPAPPSEDDVRVVEVRAEQFGEMAGKEQRREFLVQLMKDAKAADSIHLVQLPMEGIRARQKEAELVGLHGCVVAARSRGDGLLVLGAREEAVRLVSGKINEGVWPGRRGAATATAAMVGAAAAWGVLAFT